MVTSTPAVLHKLIRMPLFNGLAEADLAGFLHLGRDCTAHKDAFFFLQGDPATHLYILTSGRVKLGLQVAGDVLHHRVGLAHAGDPAQGDSQFYIMLAARPGLDGKYAVFGQVVSGMDVVEKLEVGDVIKRMTVK